MRRIERVCLGWFPPKANPEILSDCHNVPVFVHGSDPDYWFTYETCRKACTVHAAAEVDMIPTGQDLTPMEREVLRLFMRGYNDKWIAINLVITRDTVLFHLRNIATKWGVRTRDEVRAYADQHQLVP